MTRIEKNATRPPSAIAMFVVINLFRLFSLLMMFLTITSMGTVFVEGRRSIDTTDYFFGVVCVVGLLMLFLPQAFYYFRYKRSIKHKVNLRLMLYALILMVAGIVGLAGTVEDALSMVGLNLFILFWFMSAL